MQPPAAKCPLFPANTKRLRGCHRVKKMPRKSIWTSGASDFHLSDSQLMFTGNTLVLGICD